jgi:hypothetical protein
MGSFKLRAPRLTMNCATPKFERHEHFLFCSFLDRAHSPTPDPPPPPARVNDWILACGYDDVERFTKGGWAHVLTDQENARVEEAFE